MRLPTGSIVLATAILVPFSAPADPGGLQSPAAPAALAPQRAAGSAAGPAATPLRLTLRQCIELALNNNLDIEIARYQPQIREQDVIAALGAFDNILFLDTVGGESNTSNGSGFLGGASVLDQDSFSIDSGVRRKLPFGTSYEWKFTELRTFTNSVFSDPNPQHKSAFGLSVTQPLLKGMGYEANWTTVVLAKVEKGVAIDDLEVSLAATLFEVHRAYWQLAAAIEEREVQEQALEVERRLREVAEERFRARLAAEIEVIQARAGEASQLEGLLIARNNVLAAQDALKRVVDPSLLRDTAHEISLEPADRPEFRPVPVDRDASLQTALSGRPEIRSVRKRMGGQDAKIAQAHNATLPRVDLTGGYRLDGLGSNFGNAVHQEFQWYFHDWNVGLGIEVPLGNLTARSRLHQAELEQRVLYWDLRRAEQQVIVDVRAALRDLETTEQRIEATARAREYAERQFEAERKRLELGLSTYFQLLEIQRDFTQARTNEIRARIDRLLAEAALDRATGEILARHDIHVLDQTEPRLPIRSAQ